MRLKLEQTLDKDEKVLYRGKVKEYRLGQVYHQIMGLDNTWQYRKRTVAQKAAQGYAKGFVLQKRELEFKYER